MKWSWQIGSVFGIGVYLHFTFLILLGAFGIAPLLRGDSIVYSVANIVTVTMLFGIVVLHELGHALAARRFGIPTRDITLLPIGGVARLERMPEDPKQELVVALAGPAVNVVLALGAYLVAGPAVWSRVGSHVFDIGFPSPSLFFQVNVVLAVFNMIPAFPMDGGRVLRAILAFGMDHVLATRIASFFGQGFALLFLLYGLLSFNVLIMFVALFVWLGASEESSLVQAKSALSGVRVKRAMITDFQALAPTDSLRTAADHVIAGFQQDFPVVAEGQVVGVLTRQDLLTALAQEGHAGHVADAMQRTFLTVGPEEMLDSVFLRLQECDCRSVPVVENGHLVGLVNLENVGEFIMVQSALQRTQK